MREDLFTADGNENFGVLYCSVLEREGGDVLLAKEWESARLDAYTERLPYHLEISPAFLNCVIDHSLGTHLTPVIVHSHPAARDARYSPSDDHGEGRLLPVLEDLLPGLRPASVLASTHQFAGRSVSPEGFMPLSEIQVAGRVYRPATSARHSMRTAKGKELPATHDRQVRAIGADGQRAIESLRVAIIGAGGTGSAVAEQLVRLGIQDLLVVDHDLTESSNLSRMWGSVPADAASAAPKAEVVAKHLLRIAPSATVSALVDDVTRQSVLTKLSTKHLIFACTDNHWSRAVLNRFAHQYLIPIIDMGVRVDRRSGVITAIGGQVSVVHPGYACLRCSGLINQDLVRAESMPPAERFRLAKEGYVQGVGDPAPSVISLNTVVAGLAVSTAVGLLVPIGPEGPPPQLRYDGVRGDVFRVEPRHEGGCDVCDPKVGIVALGDAQPVSAYD